MKTQTIISIVIIVFAVALAVLSYFILPESVIIQFSLGESQNTAVPKLFAILIPFAMSLGGGLLGFFIHEEGRQINKGTLIGLVGIALFAIMLLVNCCF